MDLEGAVVKESPREKTGTSKVRGFSLAELLLGLENLFFLLLPLPLFLWGLLLLGSLVSDRPGCEFSLLAPESLLLVNEVSVC